MTAKEAYDKTEKLLEVYAQGEAIGGDPMQEIKKYAKEKCKEQRILCDKYMSKLDNGDENHATFGMIDAPEPNFD